MRLLLLSVLLLLLSSCTPVPVPVQKTSVDVAQIMTLLHQRQQRVHALAGLADVTLRRQDKRWSVTQAVLVEYPQRLRLDVVNFFGQVQMQLVIDSGRLQVYVPADGRLYRGWASAANLERFAGMNVSPPLLAALLLGRLPDGVLEQGRVTACRNGVELFVDPGRYRVIFDDNRIQSICYSVNNNVVYKVVYSAYNRANGFASHIVFSMPQQQLELDITMDDVELNPAFTGGSFVLQPPATVAVEDMDRAWSGDQP